MNLPSTASPTGSSLLRGPHALRRLLQRKPVSTCKICKQPNRRNHECKLNAAARVAKQVQRTDHKGASYRLSLFEGWLYTHNGPFWRCGHTHGDSEKARQCASDYLVRCQIGQAELRKRLEPKVVKKSRALQRVIVDRPRPMPKERRLNNY